MGSLGSITNDVFISNVTTPAVCPAGEVPFSLLLYVRMVFISVLMG